MAEYKMINLRVKPEEHERWMSHAKAQGRTLTGVIRDLLNRDCGAVEYLPPPPPLATIVPPPPESPLSPIQQIARKMAATSCVRRLPKGTYCKSCERMH